MALPDPSNEQLDILLDIIDEKNVYVDAVAGSGKTTLALHIAKQNASKNILLLTYNKNLKFETREKAVKYSLDNLEVHTYHSFGYKYYDNGCSTDAGLIKVVEDNYVAKTTFAYDIIILDETQDMTQLYFNLVCKISKENQIKDTQYCVVGDNQQCIFVFNKADSRFLTYANKNFLFNEKEWTFRKLSVSFRATEQIANFLNNCVLREERIHTRKSGPKVRYIIDDCFGNDRKNMPYNEVKHYLAKGYKYDDFFILAPSVKSEQSPLRQLANKLSEEGIPVFVPNSDEAKIDEDILKGKMAFTTFYQVKGLERKVVLVYGVDATYFIYFEKDDKINHLICPNTIYVALTRALECLTIFHHYDNDYIPFLNKDLLNTFCEVITEPILVQRHRKNISKKITVTDVIKFIPCELVQDCCKFFDKVLIQPVGDVVHIPMKSKQGSLYESVCEITGTAIPAYFEKEMTNKMTIYNVLQEEFQQQIKKSKKKNSNRKYMKRSDVIRKIETLPNINNVTPANLLTIANKYMVYLSGYTYKMKQISSYDWLTKDNLNECVMRMRKYVSKYAVFEKYFECTNSTELYGKTLVGYADCIDRNVIWEFKCVEKIDDTHFMQLILYAYLNLMNLAKTKKEEIDKINRLLRTDRGSQNYITNMTNLKRSIFGLFEKYYQNVPFRYMLFNILTNEIWEIKISNDKLKEFVRYFIFNKFHNIPTEPDEAFLERVKENRDKYFLGIDV